MAYTPPSSISVNSTITVQNNTTQVINLWDANNVSTQLQPTASISIVVTPLQYTTVYGNSSLSITNVQAFVIETVTTTSVINFVTPYTILSGQIACLGPGLMLAVDVLTVNGTLINYGIIKCKSVVYGLGGSMVKCLGSSLEINSAF